MSRREDPDRARERADAAREEGMLRREREDRLADYTPTRVARRLRFGTDLRLWDASGEPIMVGAGDRLRLELVVGIAGLFPELVTANVLEHRIERLPRAPTRDDDTTSLPTRVLLKQRQDREMRELLRRHEAEQRELHEPDCPRLAHGGPCHGPLRFELAETELELYERRIEAIKAVLIRTDVHVRIGLGDGGCRASAIGGREAPRARGGVLRGWRAGDLMRKLGPGFYDSGGGELHVDLDELIRAAGGDPECEADVERALRTIAEIAGEHEIPVEVRGK